MSNDNKSMISPFQANMSVPVLNTVLDLVSQVGMMVTDLQNKTGLAYPAIHRHLQDLQHAAYFALAMHNATLEYTTQDKKEEE